MSQKFLLKNVKLKMTRNLNYLATLITEANEYREWEFPSTIPELELFLLSNRQRLQNLISTIKSRREYIIEYYNNCNNTINDLLLQEEQSKVEQEFDEYWVEKKGETLLQEAEYVVRQLEKRLVELECQETIMKQDISKKTGQTPSISISHQINPNSAETQTQLVTPPVAPQLGYMLERRLLGNELKIPQFNGKPSEFAPFWELFEELVHKQPYSNIEKLSILLSSCKGDAARALQMIPRTGDSYEKAISQLKAQYEDPKQITLQMIRQLKSMKQCREDARSLRNNLSDVHAVIATLERQGETVNTTYMQSMVLETFPQTIQDEMAKKEFDSDKTWTMTELLDNLTLAVKRKEHIANLKNTSNNEYSVFHTSTRTTQLTRCVG
ncbi:unnamed protein product [Haemonchus placei]|uniref:Uncharacterized protein n=1 Tax=Haemonchus placei TaxID=6290 RepID=A0A0N4VW86_HAEPC|nr:unnamed protein product [Haemonchus placei]